MIMTTTTTTKQFHIGDVLSITTGRLVSPEGMSGVQGILEWMADGPVWTHQLPRVADEAAPVLRTAFPDLATTEPTDEEMVNKESAEAWLESIVAEHGAYRDVPQMAPDDHAHIDPIAELSDMVGADRVIPVVVDDAV